MKRPGFFEGAVVAASASIAGAILYSVFILIFNMATSARLTVTMVCSAYLVYLLWRSPRVTGRITALLAWATTLFITWLINPTFVTYLLIHVTMLCLIRANLFYNGTLSVVIDLALGGVAVITAIGAYLNTTSVLVSLWSLFLVLALFSFIPTHWRVTTKTNGHNACDPFLHAQQNAAAALRKLSNPH